LDAWRRLNLLPHSARGEKNPLFSSTMQSLQNIGRDSAAYSRLIDMGFSVAGIYFCYLLYGVYQEQLYAEQDDGSKFGATAFVLLVQCIINAMVAFGYQIVGNLFFASATASATASTAAVGAAKPPQKATSVRAAAPKPFLDRLFLSTTVLTGLIYVFAMYTSNESLKYVSYSYQALAKSCKPIPVMLAGIFINKQKYSTMKYICVVAMVVGVTLFNLVPKEGGGGGKHRGGVGDTAHPSSIWGFVYLAVSLSLDGANGPLQENFKLIMTQPEQAMSNNIWGGIFMVVVATLLGQIGPSISYIYAHPDLIRTLFYFGLCSGFGQLFVFHTVRTFGSLTLSIITTTRKFATIVVNDIVSISKSRLNSNHWACVLLVFVSVCVDSLDSFKGGKKKEHADEDGPAAPSAGGGGGAAGAGPSAGSSSSSSASNAPGGGEKALNAGEAGR
jgi:UDP-galactose transporter B1